MLWFGACWDAFEKYDYSWVHHFMWHSSKVAFERNFSGGQALQCTILSNLTQGFEQNEDEKNLSICAEP
jgi:hypothetical protein